MNDTAWICIAAVAIVGIVALAFVFKNDNSQLNDSAVKYTYDDKNRLESVIPIKRVTLKEVS